MVTDFKVGIELARLYFEIQRRLSFYDILKRIVTSALFPGSFNKLKVITILTILIEFL